MKLFLLTAAHDQHVGFSLARKYVNRGLSLLPSSIDSSWIVSDDGRVPVYDYGHFLKNGTTDGVILFDSDGEVTAQFMHMRQPTRDSGLESFRSNMVMLARAVIELADPEDICVVVEDDWFSEQWLADGCKAMIANPDLLLFGETRTRYYRVDNRRWHVFNANGRAALSGTMFRAAWGMDVIRRWEQRADATIMLDDVLWKRSGVPDSRKLLLPESQYVVGIKGLPGARGLGMGGSLNESHKPDADGRKLAEWVGDDAGEYLKFFREQPC